MILAQPGMIPDIDKYAGEKLGIPTSELMHRAGEAVANAVRSHLTPGARVIIFSGKGNNGGDGYAAALSLNSEYEVCVYDVFGEGQKSEDGGYFLNEYLSAGGIVLPLDFSRETFENIDSADCVIDAIFGTGFVGKYPEKVVKISRFFRSLEDCLKIAIDIPIGVNAADGRVEESFAYRADVTVALGYIKPGLVSYPAKEYVGKLIYDNIGLQNNAIYEHFQFCDYYIDYELASSLIPQRPDNSNKGTFGKLLMLTGSDEYFGAAQLSLEAALRGGVGLVSYLGEKSAIDRLSMQFPEAIYKPLSLKNLKAKDIDNVDGIAAKHSAILVGSGSTKSEGLLVLLEHLLSTEGPPIILDADAINVLSDVGKNGIKFLRDSSRKIILTPHPLELSRITGIPTDEIQSNRLSVAKSFAKDNDCVLVLKGAATVITDGTYTYINSSGSSALAKAGSGDVLAGFMASILASGADPLSAAVVAVYFHGLAADSLSEELSTFGVTPSDLPREIGRQLSKAQEL